MSSVSDKLLQAADVASTVQAGLQVIERLVGPHDTLDKAADALALIGKVAQTLREGLSGHLSPEEILQHLNPLKTGLAANDDAGQSELDKKFPKG